MAGTALNTKSNYYIERKRQCFFFGLHEKIELKFSHPNHSQYTCNHVPSACLVGNFSDFKEI
jgi:hypothetical protein